MTAVLAGPVMVSPTGVLAYDGPAHTDAWFAARRAGVTATDVKAIVGAEDPSSRWGRTPLHVWLDKRGELPPDDGPAHFAEAGLRLEPVIARWWADDHSTTVRETGVVQHVEQGWWRCSPDRTVDTCPDGDQPGTCGLEVKNRNAYVAGRWSDDVPDDVLAQVGWTMAVTGWGHVHVAALIGGNTPVWHRVDRDPVLEAYLIGEATRFWASVGAGVPPEVDPSAALTRLLDALYDHRAGAADIDVDQAAALYRTYRLGAALEKRGVALKDAAKHAAVQALGDAEELAPVGDRSLATYRVQGRTGIAAADLARLASDLPELHALLVERGYLTTTTHRVLRWTKKVGESLVAT